MHVALKFELECGPDAAWEAVRSPSVMEAVSWPLVEFHSLEPGGFPERWTPGHHPVEVRSMFGALPAGRQSIDISTRELGDTRIVEDSGGPVAGPVTLITRWRHRMAISPLPDGRALYRDRLEFSTVAPKAVGWAAMWSFWQWRGAGIRRVTSRLPLV